MIGWGTIFYGAVLSAVAALALLGLVQRHAPVAAVAAAVASAFVAPIAWNAILRATDADRFFTDLPIRVFPVSWQDTGSGVFTLALATLAIAVVTPQLPARRLALVAGIAGIAALLVDIYLY